MDLNYKDKRKEPSIKDVGNELFIHWNKPSVHLALAEKSLNTLFYHFVAVLGNLLDFRNVGSRKKYSDCVGSTNRLVKRRKKTWQLGKNIENNEIVKIIEIRIIKWKISWALEKKEAYVKISKMFFIHTEHSV